MSTPEWLDEIKGRRDGIGRWRPTHKDVERLIVCCEALVEALGRIESPGGSDCAYCGEDGCHISWCPVSIKEKVLKDYRGGTL